MQKIFCFDQILQISVILEGSYFPHLFVCFPKTERKNAKRGEQSRNVLLRRRIIRSPSLSTRWKIDFSVHRARHKYILRGEIGRKTWQGSTYIIVPLLLIMSQWWSIFHARFRFNCLGSGWRVLSQCLTMLRCCSPIVFVWKLKALALPETISSVFLQQEIKLKSTG